MILYLLQLTIQESIEILNYLSQFVRTKKNKFVTVLPAIILVQIGFFLSFNDSYKLQLACKSWNRLLKSAFIETILKNFLKKVVFPTHGTFQFSWNIGRRPHAICMRENKLVDCNTTLFSIQEWQKDGKLIHELHFGKNIYRMAASNKYFCFYQESKIFVFNVQNVKISQFEVNFIPHGLAIGSKFIYISSKNKIRVCSIVDGTEKYTWDLPLLDSTYPRKLAVYQEKIFMVDHYFSKISIFLQEGKIIRKNLERWEQILGNLLIHGE